MQRSRSHPQKVAAHTSKSPRMARAARSRPTTTARRTMSHHHRKMKSFLNSDTINPLVKQAEYAVRGELVIKAGEYAEQLKAGKTDLPFNKILLCNIGNPQELDQKPLTFVRQVLALAQYPDMLKNDTIRSQFPIEAIERAEKYLSTFKSTGAYTHSKGLSLVRQEVAEFIKNRDGVATDPENIWLTDGASSGVKALLQTLLTGPHDGVLCPIPQYPLYSATLTLLNGHLAGYYLDEKAGWGMDLKLLSSAYDDALAKGTKLKALVVINPGNPTGQSLPADNIKDIISFCEQRDLVILADEVYQENIYGNVPFTSFRKMVKETGSHVPLVSFHSVSKGFIGECGQRGGYFHITNVGHDVAEQLYKLSSISLCPNVSGQLTVGLMVNPPSSGESLKVYSNERAGILASLQRRAEKIANALNELEGVSCQPVAGALYAFPKITLSKKAQDAAKAAGKAPDVFYSLKLLDRTGICVVPGTGFKQEPGTAHFRITILPPEDDFENVVQLISTFHKEFTGHYRD